MDSSSIYDRLETDIGIPKGFLIGLVNEDDWSFIIKIHALLETSFTNILVAQLNDDRITDQISWLALSDSKIGKLKFSLNLGLIEKDEYNFVVLLSELRNKLVHNISQINFSIEDHISKLDKHQKKSFQKKVFQVIDEQIISLIPEKNRTITHSPKAFIWSATIFILAKNFGAKIAIEEINWFDSIRTGNFDKE